MASKANAVGLGGILFLLLRLLAVAHYDWHVAFSLADTVNFGDVIGVVVGTFLGAATLSGVLLALVLPLAVVRHVRHLREGEWKPHQTVFIVVLAGVFFAAVITLRNWPTLVAVLVASAVLLAVLRQRGPYLSKVFAHMGVVVWLAFLALGGLTDAVWVPEQRLVLRDGSTVTGYVMTVQSPYTEVLTAKDRKIRILMSQNVVSRTDVDDD